MAGGTLLGSEFQLLLRKFDSTLVSRLQAHFRGRRTRQRIVHKLRKEFELLCAQLGNPGTDANVGTDEVQVFWTSVAANVITSKLKL